MAWTKVMPANPVVAVCGATGAVGNEFLNVLHDLDFPASKVIALASARSAGKKLPFKGCGQVPAGELTVQEMTPESFEGVDIALFSAGGSVSKAMREAVVSHGAVMIDNSSAFRMDEDVPLVVPEVNPGDVSWHNGVIANPNCSTIQMVVALKPLYDLARITRVVVSTYQAASGAGAPAMAELYDQTREFLDGKPEDELTIKAFDPNMQIIAPWRIWDIKTREEEIDYAEKRGIPVPVKKDRPYSMDRNIWHISHEGADLEDPWNEPPEDLLLTMVTPEKAPDQPEYVTVDFEQGVPVAINGEKLDAVDLLTKANEIAGRNGVGCADLVENRLVGMKSRGVYETPGGTMLYAAHGILESITLDRATSHYKELVASKFAELVYDGMWYTPLREALSAFVDSTQQAVNGTVKLKLYKGNCINAGVKSPNSLYMEEIATFGDSHDLYSHKDSAGFINLLGLPLKVKAMVDQKNKK